MVKRQRVCDEIIRTAKKVKLIREIRENDLFRVSIVGDHHKENMGFVKKFLYGNIDESGIYENEDNRWGFYCFDDKEKMREIIRNSHLVYFCFQTTLKSLGGIKEWQNFFRCHVNYDIIYIQTSGIHAINLEHTLGSNYHYPQNVEDYNTIRENLQNIIEVHQ